MYNPPRTLATLLSLASALCLLSPASASLLVYYSFDVEAGDQVANTGTLIGDGTIIGAGTYGPGQDASFGNAFIGNRAGINDARIHTGFFGNQLGMGDNTETYTALAWILWNGNLDAATEEDHMIFGQDDGEGNNPQLHHGIRGNNDPNLDNIHFGGWGGDQDISDAGTVAPDTWTHVAWQFTGTEKVVYVNGVETARLAGNNITDPTFEVVVGGHGRDAPPGGMVSFNGAIDEVKIYDDVLTAEEIIAASVPNQDRDEDGLTNTEEGNIGTDPDDPDSDDDGMNDGVEVANMLDPLSSEGDDGAEGDPDMANLGNLAELEEHRTDPQDADTDDDDLNDDRELVAMSDPNLPDTDGDTLLDGIEVDEYMTNPNLRDTDEDGFDDDVEIAQGTDPLDPLDFPGIPEPLIHYTFNTDDGAMVENLGSLGTAGTTSGGVTYGESVDPSFGMAFIGNRNGADDAKVITNHVGTELGMADNTTAYTAMAWLRWDGTAGQVDHMIFGQELADNDEQLHHGIRDDSPANIHFGGWGGTQDISDAGTVVPGEWTHV
ncbi:MAG: LamG domain-containing protein, partial [Verrucomicrobiales bacterium]